MDSTNIIATPRLTSLCYIERDGCWLVMHRTKREGDENRDKWIGVGGKFEYMHLFTCTEFTGELAECDEGELVWLPKSELLEKNIWAGDKLFLRALEERSDFFTLKLRYEGERLVDHRFG